MVSSAFEIALDHLPDGVLIVGEKRDVIYYNARFAEMWRFPEPVLRTKNSAALIRFVLDQLEHPQQFIAGVEALYDSAESSQDRVKFKDGRTFLRRSEPYLQDGAAAGRVWIFSDMTRFLELSDQANKDGLTRLFNRRYLNHRLAELFDSYQRYGINCSIAVFDLDGFKSLNDTHGHASGDRVLKELAQTVLRVIRKDDLAFRHGGDEFCILMPNTSLARANDILQRVLHEVKSADGPGGRDWSIGFSYGCVNFDPSDERPWDAVCRADEVLYQYKRRRSGRLEGIEIALCAAI